MKRLELLPGAEKWVRIPSSKSKSSSGRKDTHGGKARPASEHLGSQGLSQSLKESARHSVGGVANVNGSGGQGEAQRSSRSVFEGRTSHGRGSGVESDLSGGSLGDDVTRERVNGEERDGVKETLRSIWEKSFEMSASQD